MVTNSTARMFSRLMLKRWLLKIPFLVCIALFVFHGYVVQKYAVNIPYWDDWAMFSGDDHPASIDFSWLRAQHNEHRMATTKSLNWLQFQLNGWNYPVNLLINYVLYGGLLVCLVWLARGPAAPVPMWAMLGFTIFLLSPINWFNHFMAMQSAFHFYVLFFFLACGFLFDERQRFRELLLACLAAVLCTYSLAGGFVSTLFLLVAFCCFKVMRARQAIAKERRRELLQLILVVGIVGGALIIWTIGYVKPPHHPAIVYPYTLKFWLFFINLVSLAFGIMRISTVAGILCLLIVLTPVCGEIWKRRRDLSKLRWAPYVAVFGIFANLASISAGRAGFGLGLAKSDRYFEFVMALVLLSVINWAVFLRDKRRLKIAVLAGLWLLCCASFARKWDLGPYRTSSAERLEGVRCVKAYYQGEGDGRCPTIFPDSLAPFLEQGKRLNASYYRDLNLVSSERKTGGNSEADPNRAAGQIVLADQTGP